ncbi:hypothetical protein E1301_Tti010651 [Triplophysa tibetana]|uniref:Uncharacterized protein n=1 Tax=Triplophysa tibetana TaxID=1572043 RepID=A0A5A9PYC9_9TELE|nr:hypothetical protein E1301_Tti010651 [Triplophysa tibetana]
MNEGECRLARPHSQSFAVIESDLLEMMKGLCTSEKLHQCRNLKGHLRNARVHKSEHTNTHTLYAGTVSFCDDSLPDQLVGNNDNHNENEFVQPVMSIAPINRWCDARGMFPTSPAVEYASVLMFLCFAEMHAGTPLALHHSYSPEALIQPYRLITNKAQRSLSTQRQHVLIIFLQINSTERLLEKILIKFPLSPFIRFSPRGNGVGSEGCGFGTFQYASNRQHGFARIRKLLITANCGHYHGKIK